MQKGERHILRGKTITSTFLQINNANNNNNRESIKEECKKANGTNNFPPSAENARGEVSCTEHFIISTTLWAKSSFIHAACEVIIKAGKSIRERC